MGTTCILQRDTHEDVPFACRRSEQRWRRRSQPSSAEEGAPRLPTGTPPAGDSLCGPPKRRRAVRGHGGDPTSVPVRPARAVPTHLVRTCTVSRFGPDSPGERPSEVSPGGLAACSPRRARSGRPRGGGSPSLSAPCRLPSGAPCGDEDGLPTPAASLGGCPPGTGVGRWAGALAAGGARGPPAGWHACGPARGTPVSYSWAGPPGQDWGCVWGALGRHWGACLLKTPPWRSQLCGPSPRSSRLVLEAVWALRRGEPSLPRPLLPAVAAGPQVAGALGLSGGRGTMLLGCFPAAQEAALSRTEDVVSSTWPWVACSTVPARAGHTGLFPDFGDQGSKALGIGNLHVKGALGVILVSTDMQNPRLCSRTQHHAQGQVTCHVQVTLVMPVCLVGSS